MQQWSTPNYQHQHTPHLSMTWNQFTEFTSCHMHGENQDHALQEATIIHHEFMLEKAHMNNTSFSRIRNLDNIADMGYSLNRVSPIFGEQQTPAQSSNPRNLTSTPRQKLGHLIKHSLVPTGYWHTTWREDITIWSRPFSWKSFVKWHSSSKWQSTEYANNSHKHKYS